jgi:hypothetical protein
MLIDNPYLAQQGDYETMLLSLPEHQRKQLLEGNWDVAEGAAFSEFNRQIHVIDPMEIPEIGLDSGLVTTVMGLILLLCGLQLAPVNS